MNEEIFLFHKTLNIVMVHGDRARADDFLIGYYRRATKGV